MLAAALVVAVGRDHVRVRRTRIRIALAIPPPLVRRHEIVLRHRDRRARLRCRRGREGLSCRSRCCRRIRRPCPRLTHRVLLRHAARWQWERRRCRTAGCAAVIGRRRVLGVARRQREKRYLAALPVIQHHARRGVEVWLAALQQLPRAARNLREEVLAICPLFELVRTPQVLWLDTPQHLVHVLRRVLQVLYAHNALEHRVRLAVRRLVVHHAGAVDEEDALHQRHVLPHLRLARHWRCLAHLLGAQRIDDRRLADVRVADKADRDGLLVGAQPRELAQQ
mmetsp:Transcript_26598/g.79031  ORF Transcript_26598/g.79031 Transcript_26598/m.79031 type:complete len:281 (+) Transcript_26598:923-1765(+)